MGVCIKGDKGPVGFGASCGPRIHAESFITSNCGASDMPSLAGDRCPFCHLKLILWQA